MAITIPVNTVSSINTTSQITYTTVSEANINAPIDGADDRSFFIVDNTQGTVNVVVTLNPGTSNAKSLGTVRTGESHIIFLDSMRAKSNGTSNIAIAPANMGTTVSAVQFIPAVNN